MDIFSPFFCYLAVIYRYLHHQQRGRKRERKREWREGEKERKKEERKEEERKKEESEKALALRLVSSSFLDCFAVVFMCLVRKRSATLPACLSILFLEG